MDYERIGQVARDFRNSYNPTGLVPFPFAETAQSLGDVEIAYLEKMDNDISGAIYYDEVTKKFNIIVNATKPSTRKYFTLAHEFAHYHLHKDWLCEHAQGGFIDYNNSLDGSTVLLRPDSPPLDRDAIIKEKEANNFAAEILMPAGKVRELWELTHDIVECADAFQVSRSAMAIRLERLGLV